MTPGFDVASIQPEMSDLKKSTIRVPPIKGDILGSYTRRGQQMTYTLTFPAGMVGEFVLPKGQENVKLNGETAPTAFGSIRLFGGESVLVMDTIDLIALFSASPTPNPHKNRTASGVAV